MADDISKPVAGASEVGVEEPRFDSDGGRLDPSDDIGPAHGQAREPALESSDDSSLSEGKEMAKAMGKTRANLMTRDGVHDKLKDLDERWYVLHTYSGYKRRVKQDFKVRMHSINMEDYIFQTEVPMGEVFEVRQGQCKLVSHMHMPSYVFIHIDLADDSWRVVRLTGGMTGFVGNGRTPVALSESGVVLMLTPVIETEATAEAVAAGKAASSTPATLSPYAVDDVAALISELWAGMPATVSEVDTANQRLTMPMTLVGQEIPVELSFDRMCKDD